MSDKEEVQVNNVNSDNSASSDYEEAVDIAINEAVNSYYYHSTQP